MKYIHKGNEPEELKRYKKRPGVNYKKMARCKKVREAVKLSLLKEQGYICCYCGEQIALDERTGIEHFLSQKDFPYLDLYYRNLFVCCDGGKKARADKKELIKALSQNEKNESYPLYCDAAKDSEIISLSPLDKEVEKQFMYYDDGDIVGKSEKAVETIEKLHLNNPVLNNRRKAAVAAYEEGEYENYTLEDWQEEIDFLETKDANGKFEPFCFVKKRYIEEFKL